MHLIEEAGLAVTLVGVDMSSVFKLTWAGHDFLDTVRNEAVWKKVLLRIRDLGGSATLEIVKSLGTSALKEHLGHD